MGRTTSTALALMASVLAPAAALSVALISPTAMAAPPAAPAQIAHADCQVHAVLASKDEGGVQKDLDFLADQLKDDEFAAYKSFYLVQLLKLSLDRDKAGHAEFKSGHKLGLTLLGGQDKRLQMQLSLSGRDGKKELVSTKYGIDSGGVLMIRAGSGEFTHKSHKGKLFFAIQCVSAK